MENLLVGWVILQHGRNQLLGKYGVEKYFDTQNIDFTIIGNSEFDRFYILNAGAYLSEGELSTIANEGYGYWPESIMELLEAHDFRKMPEETQKEILGKYYVGFGRNKEATNESNVEYKGYYPQLGSNHIVCAGYELSEAERERANEGRKRYTVANYRNVIEARIKSAYFSYRNEKKKQKEAGRLVVKTNKAIENADDEVEKELLKSQKENYIEQENQANEEAKRCIGTIKKYLKQAKELGIEIDPKIAKKAEKLANRVAEKARKVKTKRGKASRHPGERPKIR